MDAFRDGIKQPQGEHDYNYVIPENKESGEHGFNVLDYYEMESIGASLEKHAARIAALEAVAEIARIALVELQAIHDDWNRELSVDCVGIEHCTTAQTIAKLSAALGGVK